MRLVHFFFFVLKRFSKVDPSNVLIYWYGNSWKNVLVLLTDYIPSLFIDPFFYKYINILKYWIEMCSKPDPEFYLLACKRNRVQPQDCVFLDDLGMWVWSPSLPHQSFAQSVLLSWLFSCGLAGESTSHQPRRTYGLQTNILQFTIPNYL